MDAFGGDRVDVLEQVLYGTDFSKYTDLKERLAEKLFAKKTFRKSTARYFTRLSDDDLEFVNAAQGLQNPLFNEDQES